MDSNKNSISVVVCTYNRCESLRRTLNSLLQQEVDGSFDYEVIVVDNNSNDLTVTVVESYRSKFNDSLRYVFEAKQGLSYARNRGVKEARGEIISFIDDDCIASTNWLTNIYSTFSKYNPVAVGGKAILHFDKLTPEWFSEKIAGALGLCDKGDKVIHANEYYDDVVGIGANISFKKEIFNKVGLFRTDLGRNGNRLGMGEETEMYQRIKRSGGQCVYIPSVIVYHNIDERKLSKNYFRKWFFEWGKWCLLLDGLDSVTNKRIFGIPCWRYKEVIKDFINLFSYIVQKSPSDIFYHKMRLICFFSYCLEKMKLIIRGRRLEHE